MKTFPKSMIMVTILLVFHFSPQEIHPSFNTSSQDLQVIEAGTFSVANSTENFTLLKDMVYAISFIGTTWNLTTSLHGNSSSAIGIFFVGSSDNLGSDFVGTGYFVINPNESVTEQYVGHTASDDLPGFNFQYFLSDATKNASGRYQVTLIHLGYHVTVGTGHLYIRNITAWLERMSSTPSSVVSSGFLLLAILINFSIFIICLKKKKRPKSVFK